MASENKQDSLNERLERIQDRPRRKRKWQPYAIAGGAFATGIVITAYAFLTVDDQPAEQNALNLPTSQVSDFQDGSGLDGFTISRPRPDTQQNVPQTTPSAPETAAAPDPVEQAANPAEMDALMAQMEELRAQMLAADDARKILEEDMQRVSAEKEEQERALTEAERERQRLEAQLSTQEELFYQQQDAAMLEEQRRQELEARRQAQEAQRQAAISSPMVAFRAGSSGTSEDNERDYDDDPSFLRDRAEKTPVTRSQVIANPANTIVQGTLIEATLETAISTQLEGNVAANVSRDVWSMDMSQVLIPRGSKLYGRYSSDISRGQRRVLIAWDRLITSDGQSVVLEGYGTDRIGRSGMTGRVNNHTLTRFSSAAAVSIVGALPALLAAAIEKESDDEISRDTAESIGQGASEALSDVMADYLDIPPTISVDQGQVVMVRINNDIEMF